VKCLLCLRKLFIPTASAAEFLILFERCRNGKILDEKQLKKANPCVLYCYVFPMSKPNSSDGWIVTDRYSWRNCALEYWNQNRFLINWRSTAG
jgi:hypothetical protein